MLLEGGETSMRRLPQEGGSTPPLLGPSLPSWPPSGSPWARSIFPAVGGIARPIPEKPTPRYPDVLPKEPFRTTSLSSHGYRPPYYPALRGHYTTPPPGRPFLSDPHLHGHQFASRSLMPVSHFFLTAKYPAGKKVFQCPQCRYVTDRKNNLKRHVATMHADCGRSLECCDIVFRSKASLRDHVMLFHRTGYRCHFCGRNFCRKALLKRHLAVHNGQKDFNCGTCEYSTSHKSNLERHQRVHTDDDDDDDDNDDVTKARTDLGKRSESPFLDSDEDDDIDIDNYDSVSATSETSGRDSFLIVDHMDPIKQNTGVITQERRDESQDKLWFDSDLYSGERGSWGEGSRYSFKAESRSERDLGDGTPMVGREVGGLGNSERAGFKGDSVYGGADESFDSVSGGDFFHKSAPIEAGKKRSACRKHRYMLGRRLRDTHLPTEDRPRGGLEQKWPSHGQVGKGAATPEHDRSKLAQSTHRQTRRENGSQEQRQEQEQRLGYMGAKRLFATPYKCPECTMAFSSQCKLAAHVTGCIPALLSSPSKPISRSWEARDARKSLITATKEHDSYPSTEQPADGSWEWVRPEGLDEGVAPCSDNPTNEHILARQPTAGSAWDSHVTLDSHRSERAQPPSLTPREISLTSAEFSPGRRGHESQHLPRGRQSLPQYKNLISQTPELQGSRPTPLSPGGVSDNTVSQRNNSGSSLLSNLDAQSFNTEEDKNDTNTKLPLKKRSVN